jgi:O-6-methylguanine DNA methyltransferase
VSPKQSKQLRLMKLPISISLTSGLGGNASEIVALSDILFRESIRPAEIARIPYGQTLSYSDLANRAGAPRAIRAAGTSTGRNPAAIFVPCHRVVGKNGSMCGFGGGLDRKRFLFGLENPGLHPDSARLGVEPG